jgi:hypothetical protein
MLVGYLSRAGSHHNTHGTRDDGAKVAGASGVHVWLADYGVAVAYAHLYAQTAEEQLSGLGHHWQWAGVRGHTLGLRCILSPG